MGCIFAELFTRKPLFPAVNYLEHMKTILEILGTPSQDDLNSINNVRARNFVVNLPHTVRVPLGVVVSNADPTGIYIYISSMSFKLFKEPYLVCDFVFAALHLLDKMLTFNPQKRISVEQALDHEYLARYHDLADEVVYIYILMHA